MKITAILATVLVASAATTSAAVFTSKQSSAEATQTAVQTVERFEAAAPASMTMQRPL
jgi:hypothetical protein